MYIILRKEKNLTCKCTYMISQNYRTVLYCVFQSCDDAVKHRLGVYSLIFNVLMAIIIFAEVSICTCCMCKPTQMMYDEKNSTRCFR